MPAPPGEKPSAKRKMKPGNSTENKEAIKSEAVASVNQIWKYVTLQVTDKEFKEIEVAFLRSLNSASNKIIQVSIISVLILIR